MPIAPHGTGLAITLPPALQTTFGFHPFHMSTFK